MSWSYRGCPVCSDGSYAFSDNKKISRPVASLLIFVSSLAPRYNWADSGPRKQKSSGSLAICPDCLAKICDGEPLPQKLRDGIAAACLAMGIKLQRALPLAAKSTKKKGRSS
jgi:hypothetical protein